MGVSVLCVKQVWSLSVCTSPSHFSERKVHIRKYTRFKSTFGLFSLHDCRAHLYLGFFPETITRMTPTGVGIAVCLHVSWNRGTSWPPCWDRGAPGMRDVLDKTGKAGKPGQVGHPTGAGVSPNPACGQAGQLGRGVRGWGSALTCVRAAPTPVPDCVNRVLHARLPLNLKQILMR